MLQHSCSACVVKNLRKYLSKKESIITSKLKTSNLTKNKFFHRKYPNTIKLLPEFSLYFYHSHVLHHSHILPKYQEISEQQLIFSLYSNYLVNHYSIWKQSFRGFLEHRCTKILTNPAKIYLEEFSIWKEDWKRY